MLKTTPFNGQTFDTLNLFQLFSMYLCEFVMWIYANAVQHVVPRFDYPMQTYIHIHIVGTNFIIQQFMLLFVRFDLLLYKIHGIRKTQLASTSTHTYELILREKKIFYNSNCNNKLVEGKKKAFFSFCRNKTYSASGSKLVFLIATLNYPLTA